MATTPEGKVKNDIKKVLNARGVWYFMPSANGFGKVGVPDFICCWEGRFLAIEAKAPGKLSNTTANQNMRIQEINDCMGIAFVADNAKMVEDVLDGRYR
jgi:hypothetical protein